MPTLRHPSKTYWWPIAPGVPIAGPVMGELGVVGIPMLESPALGPFMPGFGARALSASACALYFSLAAADDCVGLRSASFWGDATLCVE